LISRTSRDFDKYSSPEVSVLYCRRYSAESSASGMQLGNMNNGAAGWENPNYNDVTA